MDKQNSDNNYNISEIVVSEVRREREKKSKQLFNLY
jgi:hypothetical protein